MTTTPIITVEEINLQTAKNMLAANIKNRPLNERTVIRYVDDILDGKWAFTGDAIRINCDGTLIDGQHRLAAVIRAAAVNPSISIQTVVIRNLPAETQDVMDIGKPRSVGDQVAMRGIKNSPTVGSAARLILYYKNLGETQDLDKVRHSVVLQWIDAHREIEEYAQRYRTAGSSNLQSKAAVVASAWLINEACSDSEAIDRFFNMLVNGVGLEHGNPVLALRNRLQAAAAANEMVRGYYALHLVLRTWNAYRRGETLDRFLLRGRNGAQILAHKVMC